jgi:hypothetical protein
MGYNPFDFIGKDKKKRVGGQAMKVAQNVVTEHKLREMIREELKTLSEEDPCWDGYQQIGMKKKDGKEVPNCVPESYDVYNEDTGKGMTLEFKEGITEAEYQGRKVKMNKPMQGDSKKFKVYVNSGKKNKDGTIKVKKVEFGQKGMKIKKSNPERRKSFRARHNCDSPGPKTKARYWSCKKW